MKTIGLITYYNSDNYGAMLQAYALQTEINNNSCKCIVILHDRFSVKQKLLIGNSENKFCRYSNLILKAIKYPRSLSILAASHQKGIRRKEQRQRIKCAKFREDFFPNKSDVFYYSTEQIMSDPPICDAYVCGSDQIWNPERFEGAEPFYLDFAPNGRNRIAYAPSVAMTYIPDNLKNRYRTLISKFSDVSVREKKGCIAIKNATGVEPEWVMDPTFLLPKDSWIKFSEVAVKVPKRYIFCYFLGKENLLRSRRLINKLAKKLNATVVVLPYGEHFADRKWRGVEGVGPREFVALIRNAQYVITDSFHGTALSIILNKKFNVYAGTNTASYANRFDRIENILEICDLCNRKYTSLTDFDDKEIDYSVVSSLLTPMIINSKMFLKKALDKVTEHIDAKDSHPHLASHESCTGCSACYASCPKHAIEMKLDVSGFYYPVINDQKCIKCGQCDAVCPVRSPEKSEECKHEYYAIFAKDVSLRKKGSSGNAFGIFAHQVLKNGGEVYGAALSNDCRKLCFDCASNVGLDQLQKSKYFEAEMGDVIHQIEKRLAQNVTVLFTGTPCQVAGLRKYFGHHPKLILCDFICHGVPSSVLFGKYLTELENNYGSKAKRVEFRSKAMGWKLHCMMIEFCNGKKYLKSQFSDPFFIDFLKNKHLRLNCYSCNRVINSCADITIGDYWAVAQKHNMVDTDEGISVVCLRTPQGKDFFSSLSQSVYDFYCHSLTASDVDETFITRTRKPADNCDVIPEKFDMHPSLSFKAKLQKIYYDYLPKKLK